MQISDQNKVPDPCTWKVAEHGFSQILGSGTAVWWQCQNTPLGFQSVKLNSSRIHINKLKKIILPLEIFFFFPVTPIKIKEFKINVSCHIASFWVDPHFPSFWLSRMARLISSQIYTNSMQLKISYFLSPRRHGCDFPCPPGFKKALCSTQEPPSLHCRHLPFPIFTSFPCTLKYSPERKSHSPKRCRPLAPTLADLRLHLSKSREARTKWTGSLPFCCLGTLFLTENK